MDVSAILASRALPPGSADAAALRAAHTPAQQRKAAATQFEAILLRQFLGESIGGMMGGDSTPAGSVYGYLLTDTMASKLAQGGGMGLAGVIQQQLTPRGDHPSAPASSKENQ